MNRQEHLLSIVAEECVEVAQRVSKALRFGIEEVQPGQDLTNRERILYEFADLCGAMELAGDGAKIEDIIVHLRPLIDAKKEKVEKFLRYSEQVGTLTSEKPAGEGEHGVSATFEALSDARRAPSKEDK